MSWLEFRNVCFENDGAKILRDLSVTIEEGDFISIVGQSGSGKSTFLKLCSHLISPTQGDILFKNQSLFAYNSTELRKSIAYCFQIPYLFGDTVMENLSFPFTIRNLKFDQERVQELFSLFQMPQNYLNKGVKNLSGGEKQRIALLRSLIFIPEVLLLDEVTSALDSENTAIVEKVISQYHEKGLTILWITHNLEQSRKYANRLLTLEAGKIKGWEVIR
ncbi:ATP-binding cassette domain-containing protein [Desulfitobacterium sp. THU1]|uniref:ABC transporter ATP-binding protein n=1 Tax=Desulfitobacterium sp. THU1 TaxID=3138072 RepID=UPI00311FF488